jgi:hypothetical protein
VQLANSHVAFPATVSLPSEVVAKAYTKGSAAGLANDAPMGSYGMEGMQLWKVCTNGKLPFIAQCGANTCLIAGLMVILVVSFLVTLYWITVV